MFYGEFYELINIKFCLYKLCGCKYTDILWWISIQFYLCGFNVIFSWWIIVIFAPIYALKSGSINESSNKSEPDTDPCKL